MLRRHLPLVLAFLSFSAIGTENARADALVLGSSFGIVVATYDVTTGTYTAANSYTETSGGALNTSYNGVSTVITEHENFISGGTRQIVLDIKGASDFFKETSTDTLYGFLATGAYGNPMKLTTPLNLLAAVVNFSNAGGLVYGADVTSLVSQRTPFNGSFINTTNGGVAVGPVQNRGIDEISLALTVATPEPSTFALLSTAILGMIGVARRRFVGM